MKIKGVSEFLRCWIVALFGGVFGSLSNNTVRLSDLTSDVDRLLEDRSLVFLFDAFGVLQRAISKGL